MQRGGNSGPRDGSGTTVTPPNDYYATDGAPVTISNNYSISEVESSTGSVSGSYRIGDTISYVITLAIQEGTTDNVIVSDSLPAGLEYAALTSITPATTNNGFTYTVASQPSSGNTNLSWNFGTIVNEGDSDSTNDSIAITFTAKVVDNAIYPTPPATGYGSTDRTNPAELDYVDEGNVAQNVTTATDPTVNIVQPYLTIAKAIVGSENRIWRR